MPPPAFSHDHVEDAVDEIGVVAGAADHAVGAGAALQRVVAATAFQLVVVGATVEHVVEGVAHDEVLLAVADAGRRPARFLQVELLDVRADDVVGVGIDRIDALARVLHDHVEDTVDEIGIVADAADHAVGAGATLQRVVANAALQSVVVGTAVERVVEGIADQQVLLTVADAGRRPGSIPRGIAARRSQRVCS